MAVSVVYALTALGYACSGCARPLESRSWLSDVIPTLPGIHSLFTNMQILFNSQASYLPRRQPSAQNECKQRCNQRPQELFGRKADSYFQIVPIRGPEDRSLYQVRLNDTASGWCSCPDTPAEPSVLAGPSALAVPSLPAGPSVLAGPSDPARPNSNNTNTNISTSTSNTSLKRLVRELQAEVRAVEEKLLKNRKLRCWVCTIVHLRRCLPTARPIWICFPTATIFNSFGHKHIFKAANVKRLVKRISSLLPYIGSHIHVYTHV